MQENQSTAIAEEQIMPSDRTILSSIKHPNEQNFVSEEHAKFSEYQIHQCNKQAKITALLPTNYQSSIIDQIDSLKIKNSIIIDLSFIFNFNLIDEELFGSNDKLTFSDLNNTVPNHEMIIDGLHSYKGNYYLLNSINSQSTFDLAKISELINELSKGSFDIYLILTPNLLYTVSISKIIDELIIMVDKKQIQAKLLKTLTRIANFIAKTAQNDNILGFGILITQNTMQNRINGRRNLFNNITQSRRREIKHLQKTLGKRIIWS